jgi:hypothetical protein
MKMRLQWIPGLKPSVGWESDDGMWRFHVYYDPVSLEPEKVFYRNPVVRLGLEPTDILRLTRRSNPEIRKAVIAAIGDGSRLPQLKYEGEKMQTEKKAAERHEAAAIFRQALAEAGIAIGRPEFAALADQLNEDELLELRRLR